MLEAVITRVLSDPILVVVALEILFASIPLLFAWVKSVLRCLVSVCLYYVNVIRIKWTSWTHSKRSL